MSLVPFDKARALVQLEDSANANLINREYQTKRS
jgi:hypothetical protein